MEFDLFIEINSKLSERSFCLSVEYQIPRESVFSEKIRPSNVGLKIDHHQISRIDSEPSSFYCGLLL